MLDIDMVHELPLHEDFTAETVRRARAAVAWRVEREGWTAEELRTVLAALGIEGKP